MRIPWGDNNAAHVTGQVRTGIYASHFGVQNKKSGYIIERMVL